MNHRSINYRVIMLDVTAETVNARFTKHGYHIL